MHQRLHLAVLGLALGLGACSDDPLGLRPAGTTPDIDVTTGQVTLQLEFQGRSLTDLGVTNSCEFIVLVDGSGTNICQRTPPNPPLESASSVTLTVPAGTRTLSLLYPKSEPGGNVSVSRVGEPISLTVEGGSSMSQVVELSAWLGLGSGTLRVNGAAPADSTYGVCIGAWHNQCGLVGTNGSFAVLNWPGSSGISAVHRRTNALTGLESFDFAAGQTTLLGEFAATPGMLRISPTVGGKTMAELGLHSWQACGMWLRIDGRHTSPVCGPDVLPTVEGVMAGTRELELRAYGYGPDLPEVGIAAATGTVFAAELLEWEVAVDSAYGVIGGRLQTADGSPAQFLSVCLDFGGCVSSGETGEFRILSRTGNRKLVVRNSSWVPVKEVEFTLAPGEIKDLGVVSAEPAGANLTVRLLFRGSPVPAAALPQYWCGFQLLLNGSHTPTFLCDPLNPGVVRLQAAAEGEARLQLRYPHDFVVADTTINVVTGQDQTVDIELGATLGLVTARVTVNGGSDFPDNTYAIERPGTWDQSLQRWSDPRLFVPIPSGGVLQYFDFPGARLANIRTVQGYAKLSEFGYSVVAGEVTVVGTTSGGAAGKTETGDSVVVRPVDSSTGSTTVELTFGAVLQEGQTTVSSSENPPLSNPLPDSVTTGSNPIFYEISTSATVSGTIRLCFNYADDHGFADESEIRLYHGKADGTWEDITAAGYPKTDLNLICGETDSLSPFVLVQPKVPASPAKRLQALLASLPTLGLDNGETKSLGAKLEAALSSLERGNTTAAANQLKAFVNQVDALVNSGRLAASKGQELKAYINAVIARM